MNLQIHFAEPLPWLLLLLLLPVMWWFSMNSLSGLGRVRRFFALLLRTLCMALVILALAGAETQLTSDQVTVVYLLDQSESIPRVQRESMIDYVIREVEAHRDDQREDRAAVVVFGRNASVEVAPLQGDLPILYGQLESIADLRTDATNLAAALRLAQGIFPEGTSRRIVLVTDGNENMGDSQGLAELLAKDGIGLDVIPVPLGTTGEVSVERVVLPTDIRRGQPFEGRVVVNYSADQSDRDASPVRGKLIVSRRVGREAQTLSEQEVTLEPGKRVFTFVNAIDVPDFYEYEAQFVPEDPAGDALPQNNRSTAFTQVLGQGHVLLIEDWENRGNFSHLVERLQTMDIQVTTIASNDLFTNLGELQRYDCIVLADVPRSSGSSGDDVTSFSDQQIEMLVRNTEEMGCGLIMLGGQNSFGAGGWANSKLEEAMPVDFQIHNAEVIPVSALAMVMHASEIAQGNYWQKVIAVEALKLLGPQDYCGVIHWDGRERWLWAQPNGMAKVGPNRKVMLARVGRMAPGDMPDFDPSLQLAVSSFQGLPDAAIRHMIVISDGDPQDPSNGVLSALKAANVKVTTVAVGAHGAPETTRLQRIARVTGGKFYVANNPKVLPKIYQREVRRIARPLIKEERLQPIIRYRHEILEGIPGTPPINGFVLTSVKQNPLVQVLMVSPVPVEEENATLLACWTFGLGRTAVLTTDAGHRWASDWTSWEGYDKLFSQLVRWAMRPTGDLGNISITSEVGEGQVRVVVNALDDNDQPLNFLTLAGTAVGPDMKTYNVDLQQVAPGRYIGEFESASAGSYFLTVHPGGERAPARVGISVPYSSEYRDRQTNLALLENLSRVQPQGGAAGRLYEPLVRDTIPELIEQQNTFRRDLPKAITARDAWPYLVLICGCIFFADVFVRRVAISGDWLVSIWHRFQRVVLRREPETATDERLRRLRAQKLAVEREVDEKRAAARFAPETDQIPGEDVLNEAVERADREAASKSPAAGIGPAQAEEDDYTARLLKAKRAARGSAPRPRPEDRPPES